MASGGMMMLTRLPSSSRNRFVGEQRLQRTQPQHVVDQPGHQVALLGKVQPQMFLEQDFADDLRDLMRQLGARHRGRGGDVDALQQNRLHTGFGLIDRGAPGVAALIVAGIEIDQRRDGGGMFGFCLEKRPGLRGKGLGGRGLGLDRR